MQGGEANGRVAEGLDGGQVPATAFDAQNIQLIAEQVTGHGLDRGVASSVQDEGRLGAQKPRAVCAQGEVLGMPRRAIPRYRLGRIGIVPEASHGWRWPLVIIG